MTVPVAVTGGRVVPNAALLGPGSRMSDADVVRGTGIQSRRWVQEGQTALGMATEVCRAVLARDRLGIHDIDLLICATTTPDMVTPSTACRILSALEDGTATLPAYDLSAACSGYLYALQAAYDYLQSVPSARVLVVTAEVLSPLLDRDDLDTAVIFADAASATILYGDEHLDAATLDVLRPTLSARGEDGTLLSVPLRHDGFIKMQGAKVFSEAVRAMINNLNAACRDHHLDPKALRMVIPHQANQRILDAVGRRTGLPIFSNIATYGNTSSTSIPLALTEAALRLDAGALVGLCAFGGGFTFGAGVLRAR